MSGTYEHFVYTKEDANALAGVYQRSGYIAIVEDSHDPEYKLVMVYSDLDAYLDGRTTDIEDIADNYGAEYDGGGTYVGSIESLVKE